MIEQFISIFQHFANSDFGMMFFFIVLFCWVAIKGLR